MKNEINLEKVIGGQETANQQGTDQQNVPGMNCPMCKGFIPTTIYYIVANTELTCPHCGLKLRIDRVKSAKAIDALRKVKAAQENLAAKNQ